MTSILNTFAKYQIGQTSGSERLEDSVKIKSAVLYGTFVWTQNLNDGYALDDENKITNLDYLKNIWKNNTFPLRNALFLIV